MENQRLTNGWRVDFLLGRPLVAKVTDELGKQVLKDVSRSFYLSLRLLPRPMRSAASLGYLLARISDTIADNSSAPLVSRVECLEKFAAAVAGGSDPPRWPLHLLNAIPDQRERHLLERAGEIFAWLHLLPAGEAALVREVLAIIIGGQRLDLERFADASPENPVALADDASLEDYAWRVAGCVGAFWTKLGFLTMGERFSKAPLDQLLGRGVAYGKGLQMVNILRDIAEDVKVGRSYLPVRDPGNRQELIDCHASWLERADEWVGEGIGYSEELPSRRLRAASVLPALIAKETLSSLRGASWQSLQQRMKVPRSVVYRCMFQAFFRPPVRS